MERKHKLRAEPISRGPDGGQAVPGVTQRQSRGQTPGTRVYYPSPNTAARAGMGHASSPLLNPQGQKEMGGTAPGEGYQVQPY